MARKWLKSTSSCCKEYFHRVKPLIRTKLLRKGCSWFKFAITIYNTKTDKEVETQVGGDFESKPGSGDEPYPGLAGHLGPTLGIDTKVPTVNAIGGLATLDDLVGK